MTPAQLKDFIARWKAGAHMSELAVEAQLKRSALKREFIRAFGGGAKGKTTFKAMRADGAGGQVELFGGKRAAAGAVAIDDSKVPVVTGGKKWTVAWLGSHVQRELFTAPDGKEYVRAGGAERADLLYKPRVKGLAALRLKLAAGSASMRKLKKERAAIAQGNAALAKKRAKKRAAKAQRVHRKH